MINRTLIRIKVIQMAYSYFLASRDRHQAEDELQKSLDKAYELYISILVLMIDLTRLQERNIEKGKEKFLPTEEDLNPNTRFIDNKLVHAIQKDADLQAYLKDNPVSWLDLDLDSDVFMRLMLDKILHSDAYAEYMQAEESDMARDCELWRTLLKQIIIPDDDFAEFLEAKSMYWNDDLSIMSTFVFKTINRFESGVEQPIRPKYKDEEDELFGGQLFNYTINEKVENDAYIDDFVRRSDWDVERVAFMDRVIMDVAVSEIRNFPLIPTRVTLNEYIDLAKYYSTPKSGQFVNGILNNVIKSLKNKGIIQKD
jgi:N utilization substance protein B